MLVSHRQKPELDLPSNVFNDLKTLDHLSIKGSGTNSSMDVNGSCMRNLVFVYGYETNFCIDSWKHCYDNASLSSFIISCHLLSRTGPGALSIAWVCSDCTRSKRRCFTSVPSCTSSSASTWVHLVHCWICNFMLWCVYLYSHTERWFEWWKMDFKLREIVLTEDDFNGFLLWQVSSWCSCRDIELCARETKADVGRGAFTTRKWRQRRSRLGHPSTIGSLYLEMEDEPTTLSNCFRLDMSLIWIHNRIIVE